MAYVELLRLEGDPGGANARASTTFEPNDRCMLFIRNQTMAHVYVTFGAEKATFANSDFWLAPGQEDWSSLPVGARSIAVTLDYQATVPGATESGSHCLVAIAPACETPFVAFLQIPGTPTPGF